MSDWWQPQIHGGPNRDYFEISVVNVNKIYGAQKHFGWFDENKLLISHNGGPCTWPVTEFVWALLLSVASETATHLNLNPPTPPVEPQKEDV